MDSASDSLEIKGFSVMACHSASDNRGPRRIGRIRETDSDLDDRPSVSSDASPALSLTSIRMKIN